MPNPEVETIAAEAIRAAVQARLPDLPEAERQEAVSGGVAAMIAAGATVVDGVLHVDIVKLWEAGFAK